MIQLKKAKNSTIIFLMTGCLLLISYIHPIKAQMVFPYNNYSYFMPSSTIPIRLMDPFAINRFAPIPTAPAPIMASPYPIIRKAAQTTFLLGTPFSTPTGILLSLLFSPPPTTTTVTPITGTTPASVSTNPTASPLLTLKRLTTTTTTPFLPGLTSLFLPLLI
ncbi:MAG: hypothetical protein ACMUIP_03705 [bacterium]